MLRSLFLAPYIEHIFWSMEYGDFIQGKRSQIESLWRSIVAAVIVVQIEPEISFHVWGYGVSEGERKKCVGKRAERMEWNVSKDG